MVKKMLLHEKQRRVRAIAVVILCIHLTVVLYTWFQSSRFYLLDGGFSLRLIALGRLAGLLAVTFALQQFLLIGRIPIFERTFGQDRMSRLHQTTGYLVFGTILIHPFLLVLGNASLNDLNIFSQYIQFIKGYEDVFKASLAMLCAWAVVISSVWIVRRRLKYEWWYAVHLLTYAIILLAFGHQNELGTTVNFTQFFNYYWYAIYVLVLGTFIFYRFLKPILSFLKHDFRVMQVVQEAPHVVSIYMRGKNMEHFKWKPGQFAFFTFLSPGLFLGQHPFSFSYLWDDKRILRITVKGVGDYTRLLQEVPVGTKVIIQGPYGILGRQIEKEFEVLLVAGGIGITPIRCLFERYARSGRDVELVYAARTPQDLALKPELDALVGLFPNAKVHYLAEHDAGTVPGVYEGRITKEFLLAAVPNIPNRQAFVCGPPAMADAIEHTLQSVGMPEKKIYVERFSLHKK